MPEYYTDSARKSLWVLTKEDLFEQLICFAADKNSGFHIGQQCSNPQLKNSNWQPLEGEIAVSQILC